MDESDPLATTMPKKNKNKSTARKTDRPVSINSIVDFATKELHHDDMSLPRSSVHQFYAPK